MASTVISPLHQCRDSKADIRLGSTEFKPEKPVLLVIANLSKDHTLIQSSAYTARGINFLMAAKSEWKSRIVGTLLVFGTKKRNEVPCLLLCGTIFKKYRRSIRKSPFHSIF